MKLTYLPNIGLLMRETLSLSPPEYFCILNRTEATFQKIIPKKKSQIISSIVGDSADISVVEELFKKLKDSKEYYGQSVIVLINNSAAYAYIKFLKEQKLQQVADVVKSLQNDEVKFSQAVSSNAQYPLFTGQGIKKDYLSKLESLSKKYQIPITEIVTLPAYLALNLSKVQSVQPGIALYQLGPNWLQYLLWDSHGNVVSGQASAIQEKDTLESAAGKLKSDLFEPGAKIPVYFYSLTKSIVSSEIKQADLSLALGSDVNKARKTRSYFYKPLEAKQSRGIQAALNSFRLLALTLATVCSIALFAALITTLAGMGKGENIEHFQTLYSNTMKLERELDSLKQLSHFIVSKQPVNVNAASIVSGFSQKKYKDVFLTQLSVNKLASDSVRVEARGLARKESGVFNYQQHLNAEFDPTKITLNSLKPEIQTNRETVDTLLVFSFGVLINECNPIK